MSEVPLFSRSWVAVLSPLLERLGLAEPRRRLVAGLRGTVVEVGAGTGVSFAHYPPEVTRVVAVEPDPLLRAHALRRAGRAAVSVEVVDGDAEALPLVDRGTDAVVFGLVLCTVPDVAAALAEARPAFWAGWPTGSRRCGAVSGAAVDRTRTRGLSWWPPGSTPRTCAPARSRR